jgi:hypothetical protein
MRSKPALLRTSSKKPTVLLAQRVIQVAIVQVKTAERGSPISMEMVLAWLQRKCDAETQLPDLQLLRVTAATWAVPNGP